MNSESFEFLANAIVATIDPGLRADSMKDLPKASLETPEVRENLSPTYIHTYIHAYSNVVIFRILLCIDCFRRPQ